jgi:hypothetical protein
MRARAIKPAGPASSEPAGAQSPFERHVITVVAGAAYCAAVVPVATTALNSRAPSRCKGRSPIARASVSMSATSKGVPPEGMCVFSSDTIATCG